MTRLTLVLGTARESRLSEHVADYVKEKLSHIEEFEVSYADVRDFLHSPRTIPDWEGNSESKPWRDLVAKTDAFMLVVPEYNHSFPGELKLLLDQDFKNYERKPVVIVGTSAGSHGGLRAIEHLHAVVNAYKMIFVPAPLRFGSLEAFASKSHEERDAEHGERFEKTIDTLRKYL